MDKPSQISSVKVQCYLCPQLHAEILEFLPCFDELAVDDLLKTRDGRSGIVLANSPTADRMLDGIRQGHCQALGAVCDGAGRGFILYCL